MSLVFVAVVCLSTFVSAQTTPTSENDDPQIETYNRILRIREIATFKIETKQSLDSCIFTLPGNVSHELKREDEVNWPPGYQRGAKFWYGGPMKDGKCSLSVKADENLGGIVQADVKKVGSTNASKSALTVRVTGLSEKALPVFAIEPKKSSVLNGEIVTISCNADRPIDVCRFILPDGRELDFDQGAYSKRTEEFRYQGVGLHDGKCALRLKAGLQHNGLVLCKIGLNPLNFNGKWDSGVMIIETKARYPQFSNGNHDFIVVRPKSTTPKPFPAIECGRNKIDAVSPLISNGKEAIVGQFPWHAGIYKTNDLKAPTPTYTQQCGGTLITPSLVLTAAHCFVSEINGRKMNKNLYKIALGKHLRDWGEDLTDSRVQRMDIKEIHVQKRYIGRRGKYQYDIAVVQLTKDTQMTDFVGIICMDWDSVTKTLQLSQGNIGVVAGWGVTEEGKPSSNLHYVELPWVSEDVCLPAVQANTQVENYYTIDKFCAGYQGKKTSVCKGDSGGGLVFRNVTTDSYYLRGIVSVSFELLKPGGLCAAELYTGFTDISSYLKDFVKPIHESSG